MGAIVTFYSFKGGVGRSMALANIGVILAQRGLKVLLVDWDLEAPGLEQYFKGLKIEPSHKHAGMLDLLLHASWERRNQEVPNWRDYVSEVQLGAGSTIDLITAGQQNGDYAARLTKLDWATFFSQYDGGEFLESLRLDWAKDFSVTLIDSRTGLTDAGGVCTIQMPDILVAVFTPNDQNLNGICDVVDKAQRGRQRLAFDRMPLTVLPLPSRFDGRAEVDEAQEWLDKSERRLAGFYADWVPTSIGVRQVIELTKIPYVAHFSYGEKLPVLTHGTTDPDGPGYYYEKVASLIESDLRDVELIFPVSQQPKSRESRKAAEAEGLRRRVERAAAEWYAHQRAESWLWRGEILDDACRLQEAGTIPLGPREAEFLAAGVRMRKREEEKRRQEGLRGGFLGEPFKHDLFVSYSHGGFDSSGDSNLKKWSQAFVRELEGELRQHPKFSRIQIFADQDHRPDQGVDPTNALTEQLRNEISLSGMLVVLMSPAYLQSRWCRDELDWWVQDQRKFGLAIERRIAVARIWPTEYPWPKALVDERGEPLTGFTFYDLRKADSRPQPYDWPDPTGAKGPFREVLLDMVGRIWQHLATIKEELEERGRHEAHVARLAARHGQVIYLHARAQHTKLWERVGDALVERGFVVLPSEPDPVESDPRLARAIAERRIETLAGCDGLLLLATQDGRALDADLVVVGRQDRHSARAWSERLLPCAVLNTVGPEIATPRRKAMARSLGIEWIDAPHGLIDVESWLAMPSATADRT